jgi:hypothetical protein
MKREAINKILIRRTTFRCYIITLSADLDRIRHYVKITKGNKYSSLITYIGAEQAVAKYKETVELITEGKWRY